MNKRNYYKELESIIADNEKNEVKPKLFLHSCCAPCSSHVLLYLAEKFDIIDFFYNPNISPKDEYDKRNSEIQRFIRAVNEKYGYSIEFIEGDYNPSDFFEAVKGLEDLGEGSERCFQCFNLRLMETAKMAAMNNADYFATTLTISPLKNAEKINEIGEEISKIYKVKHLPSDFKKKEGYKHSIELSKEYDLYRQDFCGCVFSKKEAMERKKEKDSSNAENN